MRHLLLRSAGPGLTHQLLQLSYGQVLLLELSDQGFVLVRDAAVELEELGLVVLLGQVGVEQLDLSFESLATLIGQSQPVLDLIDSDSQLEVGLTKSVDHLSGLLLPLLFLL